MSEKKIRWFPQGGSCSSQMGTVTCFSCTCALLARTCLKEPLCALLQLPSGWFATSCGFGGPCWKMEMYVHGVVQGNKAATFQLAELQWEINSSESCRRLEKTLLISLILLPHGCHVGQSPSWLNSKITLHRA